MGQFLKFKGTYYNKDHIRSIERRGGKGPLVLVLNFTDGTSETIREGIQDGFDLDCLNMPVVVPAAPGWRVIIGCEDEDVFYFEPRRVETVIAFAIGYDRMVTPLTVDSGDLDQMGLWALIAPDGQVIEPWNRNWDSLEAFLTDKREEWEKKKAAAQSPLT